MRSTIVDRNVTCVSIQLANVLSTARSNDTTACSVRRRCVKGCRRKAR